MAVVIMDSISRFPITQPSEQKHQTANDVRSIAYTQAGYLDQQFFAYVRIRQPTSTRSFLYLTMPAIDSVPRKGLTSPGSAKVRAKRRKRQISERMSDIPPQRISVEEAPVAALRSQGWRSRFIVVIFGLLFAVLVGRAFFLATNPLMKLRAAMFTANSPQNALFELAQETAKLHQLSASLESMSINQLRETIQQSAAVAQRAALEFSAQSRAWSELRGRIREDSSTYEALRADLARLQSLQQQEIVGLKRMLDEAQRPSIFADALNLSLSFSPGVLSSILASWMYERWGKHQSSTASRPAAREDA